MQKVKLTAQPDIVFMSPERYDENWRFVYSEFQHWGISRRECIPRMNEVLNHKAFYIVDWNGEPFQIPEDCGDLFDENSEFASISRFLVPASNGQCEPKQRARTHHRTRLLRLFADALYYLRTSNQFHTRPSGYQMITDIAPTA